MPTPHEAFALLTRLDVAIACREKLMDQRRNMIAQKQRTGQRVDEYEFAFVQDSLKINAATIEALQATLKALGVSP